MNALPIHPTERDRERFRDAVKQHLTWCDFNRTGIDGEYKCSNTRNLFRLWWSVERERQLLQNLNQSQGLQLTEWENKYAVLASEYQSTCAAASDTLERLEKAQMEIEALSTENGFVHQHAEEDKKELRERLEKAEAEIAVADPRLHPEWKGRNSYGLDMDYFRRKLEQVLRGLDRYTPEEFARAMAVHSRTADESVIAREFVPAVAVPAVAAVECLAHETECRTCKNDISKCVGAFKPELALPADLLQSAPQPEVRHD